MLNLSLTMPALPRWAARLAAAAGLAALGACATVSERDPVPSDYPVHGIDVSKYQGEIDWHQVRRGGVAFAYIKATEGGDHTDEKFLINWNGAEAAGVPRGAYHFTYWCRPGHEQAAWFKANVPRDPDALPPVLDVEWNGHSKTCPKKLSRSAALQEMRVMLREMEAHSGKRPVIYTDITFYNDVLSGGELPGYPIWVRSINRGHPTKRFNRDWHFWQYTAKGRVPGIQGDVDRNAFHSTAEVWAKWAKGDW